MRLDDDPDVGGWQVDPGRAPGLNKGKLALVTGAGLLVLGGYLLVPMDWLWSGVLGSGPAPTPTPSLVGSTLDLRSLNGLASSHTPKPPAPPPLLATADAIPVAAPAQDLSLYDELKSKYDRLNACLQSKDCLMGLTGGEKAAPTAQTRPAQVVDAEAQKRREEMTRRRAERMKSTPVFLTRPKADKVGQLQALKSPFSLAPSEEIPCETQQTISSETPGAFVATVSQDVPDTATRRRNVIPRGSKFVLKPRRSAIIGDSRIDVQVQTLTFPSGPWLKMPMATVTDQYGTSGFTGQVDNHYFRNYSAVILTGVMRAGSSIVAGGYGASVSERVSGAVAQETTSEATRDLRQAIRTDPTITVETKYPCKLILEDELVLTRAYPWTK